MTFFSSSLRIASLTSFGCQSLLGGLTKPRGCKATAAFCVLHQLTRASSRRCLERKSPNILQCRGFVARMGIEPITSGL